MRRPLPPDSCAAPGWCLTPCTIPEQTLLIKEARLKGCRVVTGVDMFIRQVGAAVQGLHGAGAADGSHAAGESSGPSERAKY